MFLMPLIVCFPKQMTEPITSRLRTRQIARCECHPQSSGAMRPVYIWVLFTLTLFLADSLILIIFLLLWMSTDGSQSSRTARSWLWTMPSRENRTMGRTTSSRSWPRPSWEKWKGWAATTSAVTAERPVRDREHSGKLAVGFLHRASDCSVKRKRRNCLSLSDNSTWHPHLWKNVL